MSITTSTGIAGKFMACSMFALLIHHAAFSQNQVELARQFLSTSSSRKQDFHFPFDNEARCDWRRTPGKRPGLALFEMDIAQKHLLHVMLSGALSTAGYQKITHILFNEDLARHFDTNVGQNRYWFAVYGSPKPEDLWGWRLEGHHLSLNFTLRGDTIISVTPLELGSLPATVINDSVRSGFRNLGAEMDLAFQLATSLTPSQRNKAIVTTAIPNDGLLGEKKKIPGDHRIGINWLDLTPEQRINLQQLVNEYLSNTKLQVKFDTSLLNFAWWGSIEHYGAYRYRISDGQVLIDFENLGNHIHCVLRSLKQDFGTNPFDN